MKSSYLRRQRISDAKVRQLVRECCLDSVASEAALRTKVSRKIVNRLYALLCYVILKELEVSAKVKGEVEIDKSYFGPRRPRGRRGRGADRIIVFGVLARNRSVYTQVVKNCSKQQLLPIIQEKILEYSEIYSDDWAAYRELITLGYRHYRIHHTEGEYARGKNHINGIESFWSVTKRRLRKFNGVPKDKFVIHLKESEYRRNHRNHDLYRNLLRLLRKYDV